MKAPAKINLYLHVTGKRNDGYHLLDSLITPIDLYDEIEIRPSEKLQLQITGEFAQNAGGTEDNIVLKAANLLASEANMPAKARIILQKNIPVGAGLGGGSSDAAAVLRMLNDFWNLHYPDEKLAQIGLQLGADVPFCLGNKPALVSGIGEIVKPVHLPKLYILLVNPNVHLATKDVFQRQPIQPEPAVNMDLSDDKFINSLKNCRNDLEKNATILCPQITDILQTISKQNGCLLARMSGSGSTCFGLFDGEETLEKAAETISKEYKEWYVKTA